MARANFVRCSQLKTNVFHACDFHAVSMCLSRALMVTGKQSGLGAIGRLVVAVRLENGSVDSDD